MRRVANDMPVFPGAELNHSGKRFTRRDLLKWSAILGVDLLAGCKGGSFSGNTSGTPSGTTACAKLSAIQNVVILIQENRSFDHYFGSYRGVRGFSETSAAFQQPDPSNTGSAPIGKLLPFHLDQSTINAACTPDITHDWVPQHQSWDNGAMDGFVTSRLGINASDAVLTMGYYNRADLPYYYALADAFTICDNYFCSVIGPTDPNRLYTMAASIDPAGANGGPLIESLFLNRAAFYGKLTYTTMPEQLQARGISWKVYSSPDATVAGGILSDNVLSYFKNFQDTSSVLNKNAFGPQFPVDFLSDIATGNLPQVSWLILPVVASEHPPAPALFGESAVSLVITALTANPSLWAKTAFFVTYDENGGFFDHVPPVTAPPGTAGEYITAPTVPDASAIGSPPISGPIGLGFRVPMTIVSPFSRGGFVSSDLFDHTSTLRFLETLFGAEVPNLTAWRRATVGDMTSAFNFKTPDQSIPNLPSPITAVSQTISACATTLTGVSPTVPSSQALPAQETGSAPAPSGVC